MTQTREARDPAALDAWRAANELLLWLQEEANREPLFLHGVRKDERSRSAKTFVRARQAGTEEVYWGVARLFAHYNRTPSNLLWVNFGTGSVGSALARLSWDERVPGSSRVYLNTLLRLGVRPPWRELMRTCIALRVHGIAPPDWRDLVLDLSGSNGPRRKVCQRWCDDFYASNRRYPK
ncbi:type I-E CRISPR-associated protein Cse2/CasB [Kitasatospora sp. NPDC058478]|uniref:type I-E CRISPR-associated protein Cse2/CasB n=1 Tax=unclassified Kitasatospora TaxID=2633591 RepID=UPI00364FE715